MNRINTRTIFCTILISVVLLAGSFSIVGTFAKHLHISTGIDSAEVAEFDIEIIAPPILGPATAEDPYQYSFSAKGQSRAFGFRIKNNKEVAIICTPYIEGNVQYTILGEAGAADHFVLEIGESVDFRVDVLSDGLTTKTTVAKLVIDIEQL